MKWLKSPDGWQQLMDAPTYDAREEFATQDLLRREGLDPDQVAGLMLQAQLRYRAREKFGDLADGMLFTPDGLEQASRLEVSAVHARRFADASLATVHDLGCGIGSDAMAMSALGVTVAGVDIDPVTAAVADANLRPWPDSRARVGSAEGFVPPADPRHARVGVWFDPARRVPGVASVNGRPKRVFRLDQMSPSWETICAIAQAVGPVGAKMAPTFPHEAIPDGAEAQWLSFEGTLVECGVWWGPLAIAPGRSAAVLTRDGIASLVTEAMADGELVPLGGLTQLGGWLYEPDRAVTQAGLLGAVTALTGGGEVDAGLGYVSTDREVDVPFAKRYAVIDAMPYRPKTLRAWLRERNITGVTIKKRGIRTDETQLRRELGLGRGAGSGGQATLILTRVAGNQTALLVEPR